MALPIYLGGDVGLESGVVVGQLGERVHGHVRVPFVLAGLARRVDDGS